MASHVIPVFRRLVEDDGILELLEFQSPVLKSGAKYGEEIRPKANNGNG